MPIYTKKNLSKRNAKVGNFSKLTTSDGRRLGFLRLIYPYVH